MSYVVEQYNRFIEEAYEAYENQDYSLALAKFESCYSYIERKSVSVSPEGEWEVYYYIALCRTRLGKYYSALRAFITLLDEFEEKKTSLIQFEYYLYYNAADVYAGINQWLNTQEMLELALKTEHANANPDSRISVIWYLGDVYREKGEFEEALKYYEETKKYYEGKLSSILQLNTDIAELYSKQGKKDEALSLLKENLRKNDSLEEPDSYIRSRTIAVMIDIYIQILSESEIENTKEIFSYSKKLILQQLESLELEKEEIPIEKVKWFALFSKLSSFVNDTKVFPLIDNFLNETDLMTTSIEATPAYLKDVVQIYRDLANYYFDGISEKGTNLHNLKTLELYKKLDGFIDRATNMILSPIPQREYHMQFTYVGYRIFNLYQMIYQEFWEDFLYEALGMVEKYKGYDLFLSLEDAVKRKDYWEKLNELEYEIIIKGRYLESESNKEKKKELKVYIEELQNKYFDIENEMIMDESRSKPKTDPAKIMIETLEPLNPLFQKFKFGILYFAMDNNILYIVAFAKDTVVLETIEFNQKKLEKAEAILEYVREGAASITSKEDIIKLDKFLKKLSGFFSKRIMTPQIIELIEKVDYLTIIPSGLFINYPLEILRIGDENYLGLIKNLSREFNLKLLSLQYSKVVEQKWYQYNNLSKGKPITSNIDLDILREETDVIFVSNPNFEENMVLAESEIELKIVPKELIENGTYQKSECWNMDLGETEVQSIIPLFDEKQVKYKKLINTEVSKPRLLENLTNNIKIFHFAGHALFDSLTPQLSKLVLRNSKILTPMDLQKFRFRNNPLIIFSACESGVSEVKAGDEPFGFLRFTKIMNGQNIIFSLWPVLSKPTTRLMVLFYEHILSGYSIAEAMRRARTILIEEVNSEGGKLNFYKDLMLFYWSPFSFIGMPFYQFQVEHSGG